MTLNTSLPSFSQFFLKLIKSKSEHSVIMFIPIGKKYIQKSENEEHEAVICVKPLVHV